MGCGQSKNQIGVVPAAKDTTLTANGAPTKKPEIKRSGSKKINVKSGDQIDNRQTTSDLEDEVEVPPPKDSRKKNRRLVKKDSWVMGSQDSLDVDSDGNPDPRGGSATSKGSHHSADSGFADHEYQKVITEFSDPNEVRTVEDGFETPRDLAKRKPKSRDLGLVGTQCPQRYSAKDKERLDEQRVIASLREEGLIARPMSRATGGLAFEVAEAKPSFSLDPLGGGRATLPPVRLAKLEKRKKRRRKLTEEDIKAKLEKAEERRKEAEQQRLEKIQAVTMKSNVQNALDSFAQSQKMKEETTTSKVDQAAENREKRLKEMRDKLKAKQDYAEKVRRRKKSAPAVDVEDLPPVPSKKFSEDSPIVTGSSIEVN